MAQEAEERDRMTRRGDIEPEASRCGRAQVLEMARAGQPDQAVGEDRPSTTVRRI
jgi:hypothetical protein